MNNDIQRDPIPLTLIKANLALFKGERAELLRLLDEFRASPMERDSYVGMVSWLEAQAQTSESDRQRLLYQLMNNVPVEDEYGQLARAYLGQEEYYAEQLQPRRRGGAVVVVSLVLVFVIVAAGVGLALNGGLDAITGSSAPPATSVQAVITPTTPPDRSRALITEQFTARYPAGILQLTAFEDRSERVSDAQTARLLSPVPGARFYALQLNFECRAGICDQPPQARLRLRLEDNSTLLPRDDLQIIGETGLLPVALGRATTGWVVFEVPLLNRVEALVVIPQSAGDQPTEPIVLTLPG